MENKRQKCKTDPLTFRLFHFSPLTFNYYQFSIPLNFSYVLPLIEPKNVIFTFFLINFKIYRKFKKKKLILKIKIKNKTEEPFHTAITYWKKLVNFLGTSNNNNNQIQNNPIQVFDESSSSDYDLKAIPGKTLYSQPPPIFSNGRCSSRCAPTLRRVQEGRTPDLRQVLGYRTRHVPYPPCPRWWYPSCWSGSLRKHVSRWSHVCSYQDLVPLA